MRTKIQTAAWMIAGAGMLAGAALFARRSSYTFTERVVLITGGSRGLGLAVAELLAKEWARLAIVARDEAELERARERLERAGSPEVLTIACDLRNREEAARCVEKTVGHFGRIDALINDAGEIVVGPFEHMTERDYESAMGIHFWAPLNSMMAAVPHMRTQGGGRIVNIISIGGKVAVPHLAAYCASKFALAGLSDSLRAELRRDDIFVTSVFPGLMRTGSHLHAWFKGQHRDEYAWFALAAAAPTNSVNARRAAHQVVEACRRCRSQLTIGAQARLISIGSALAPGITARLGALAARILPGPRGASGDDAHRGADSESRLTQSPLTHLIERAADEFNERRDGNGNGSHNRLRG